MAKYIGSLTTDARGKVGGLVLTRARNGTNLRAKGVPIQPRSPAQLSLRSIFGSALPAWRNLSTPQQTTWALLAAQITYVNSLAQSYSPTALQLWTQAYINAATFATVPPPLAPSAPPYVAQITLVSAALVAGNLVFSAFGTAGAYPGSASISASSVMSPTIRYQTTRRRQPMGVFALTGLLTATARFRAAYGSLPAIGATLSLRAVPFDPVSYISATPALFLARVT